MSTTSLIEFHDGKANNAIEFQNSWGGSARIWTSLFDKYCKNSEYDTWLMPAEGDRRLWDLASNDLLSECERAVHAFTFDYFIVKRENFARLARHLRQFVQMHPATGKADHLNAWADAIEKSDAEAIGVHGTSVSEDLFFEWDKDKEEYVGYDLNERDEHYEVYEWLKETDEANAAI